MLHFALFLALAFGILGALCPGAVLAQTGRTDEITGLERGERDTSRLDLRMNGLEEKDQEARLREDKILPDEMRVRRELQEQELLRAGEESQQHKLRRERSDEAGAENRRRLEEQIEDKKRDFIFEGAQD